MRTEIDKLPATLQITVSEEDVHQGSPLDEAWCPIAYAVRRMVAWPGPSQHPGKCEQLGRDGDVQVDPLDRRIIIGYDTPSVRARIYRMTPAAAEWAADFDAEGICQPTAFEATEIEREG